jgi:hypothetical protein
LINYFRIEVKEGHFPINNGSTDKQLQSKIRATTKLGSDYTEVSTENGADNRVTWEEKDFKKFHSVSKYLKARSSSYSLVIQTVLVRLSVLVVAGLGIFVMWTCFIHEIYSVDDRKLT